MYKKVFYSLLLVLTLSLVTMAFVHVETEISNASAADNSIEVTENIRLYSDGELVGEWKGIGRGKVEGGTYIFTTERGAYNNQIRIKGDFVVETMPN